MTIKQIIDTILITALLSVLLLSCDGGPQATQDKVEEKSGSAKFGSASSGQIYYQTNCSACHAAGADDTTIAFGGSNLQLSKTKIQSDMSKFGELSVSGNTVFMMSRFSNIPPARVDDLNKYIASIR